MFPLCLVARDSTKACKVMEGWLGPQIESMNKALNVYDKGRKVEPVGGGDDVEKGGQ